MSMSSRSSNTQTLFYNVLTFIKDSLNNTSDADVRVFNRLMRDHFDAELKIFGAVNDGLSTSCKKELGRLEDLISDCQDVDGEGEDFAESVADSAKNMIEWIKSKKSVTSAQKKAISNWEEAILRWLD